jgi:hypothetical protein
VERSAPGRAEELLTRAFMPEIVLSDRLGERMDCRTRARAYRRARRGAHGGSVVDNQR